MAIDMSKINTFKDVQALSDTELLEYALEAGGVSIPEGTARKDVISKCASIFLNRKAISTPAPKTEAPKAEVKPVEPTPVQVPPVSKKGKVTSEEESNNRMDLSESYDEAKLPGQDYPRCGYCASAITTDTGVRDGNNKPVCRDCSDKTQKKKKGASTMAEKAAAPKKEVKGGGGNAEALKKARASVDRDEAGFKKGSHVAKVFGLIIKGKEVKRANLIAAHPSAIKFIKEYQIASGSHSTGRSAVIKHDEEKDTYKLVSYVNPDGKTIKVQ
jgi:hypothetical protein